MSNEVVEEPIVEQVVEDDPVSKYKGEMFKYKRRANEAATEAEKLKAKIQEMEEAAMREQENYKGLSEQYKNQLDQKDNDLKRLLGTVERGEKLRAIMSQAAKKNIKPEAVEDIKLLDLSSVTVESGDNGFRVLGAEEFVEGLWNTKRYWFNTSQEPVINNGISGEPTKEEGITPSELLLLQKEKPDVYQDIMKNKRHLIRR